MRKILKDIRKLHQKKFRDHTHRFLVEGIKINRLLFSSGSFEVKNVFFCPEILDKNDVEMINSLSFPAHEITRSELEYITPTATPQGIISEAAIPANIFEFEPESFGNHIIFLDRVRDPGNLGTIIRTSAWFGFKNLILFNCVDLFSPKVIRSTAGALFEGFNFYIETKENNSIPMILRKKGFQLIGTSSSNGENIFNFTFPEKSVLVFGNEPGGISSELSNQINLILKIPGEEKTESLNVGIAAGIILSFLYKQKRA